MFFSFVSPLWIQNPSPDLQDSNFGHPLADLFDVFAILGISHDFCRIFYNLSCFVIKCPWLSPTWRCQLHCFAGNKIGMPQQPSDLQKPWFLIRKTPTFKKSLFSSILRQHVQKAPSCPSFSVFFGCLV